MYNKYEKLLAERNVNSYQVSKATNIAQSTLSDWKSGKSKPKVDKLIALSKYFDVPLDYFLTDEEGE